MHIPSGPVPNDDYILVAVLDHGTGFACCVSGIQLTRGSLSVITEIGWDDRGQTILGGIVSPGATGTTLDIQATQFHANNTSVDTSAVTAWGVLEYGQSFCLMRHTIGVDSPGIADILAAVRRTY